MDASNLIIFIVYQTFWNEESKHNGILSSLGGLIEL